MPESTASELADLPRVVTAPAEPNGHNTISLTRSFDRQTLPGFGRVTRDPSKGRQIDPSGRGFGLGRLMIEERRDFGREAATIDSLTVIRDWDPQTSQAVNNFLRLMNPGHRLVAMSGLGDKATAVAGEEQDFLDDLVQRVGEEYGGGLDQLHNVLSLGLITNGGVGLEIAPTPELDGIEDWYPVNPLRFTYMRQPVFPGDTIGKLMLGFKDKKGTWIRANPDQVFHQPLDPDIERPYGRPPLLPALQTVLSKSVMLNDLRAVAHNQGYPRIDIKVLWEELAKAAPPQLRDGGKDAELIGWMQRQLDIIVSDYNDLMVDDTYVHYDWVDVNMVGGGTPGAAPFDFKALEQILTRQINSSLKSLPILLGYNETTSETHGSIQWQIQVQTVKALSRLVKRLIEHAGTSSLRLIGSQARAKLEYDPIRTVDRKYEAESAFIEAKTEQLYVLMGWKDNDEAAQDTTGNEKAVADPIIPGATGKEAGGIGGTQTDEEGNQDDGERMVAAILKDSGNPDSKGEALSGEILRSTTAMVQHRRDVSDETGDQVEALAFAAEVMFLQAKQTCIDLMREEGLLEEAVETRDTARDIADYVFGLRFSREMRRFLREAISRGMEMAGFDEPSVPEALVDRIWRSNRPFVTRLKEELRLAIKARELRTVADIDAWWEERLWRDALMGRFLARQGVTAGYAYAVSLDRPSATLTWVLGVAEHCKDCPLRAGQTYTYAELRSIGFPGSLSLDCGANCKCSLVESA